ncbi:hypothetical protein [Cellulomonas endometrii]|uniref:hypothetical protein n=1 Tax=Cellulomonas endometrii TaxID=3036301 RepID=UPI0024AC9572|nr:hypothetical protein [Cellulomonas endometrii]
MRVDVWGLISVVLIGGVVLLTRAAVRRGTRETQPDHHAEGRRVRDMTPAAKVVGVLAGLALVGMVVGRSLDPMPPWTWWCILAAMAGAVFVVVSEHRRVRRDPRLAEFRGPRPGDRDVDAR